MNNICFDLDSKNVKGYNRTLLPYEKNIYLPYPIELSKTIQESTNQKIHKTNDSEQFLYMDNIIKNESNEIISFDEVTYSEKPINFEQQTVINRISLEDGTIQEVEVIVDIPTEWETLNPVMIDEFIEKTYKLEDNPYAFNANEVVEAKKVSINNNKLTSLVYFSEDLDDNFALNNVSVGNGFMVMHPQSEAVININLTKLTNYAELYLESQSDIQVYVNDVLFVDNKARLATLTDLLSIKFVNNQTSNREIYAFGILVI